MSRPAWVFVTCCLISSGGCGLFAGLGDDPPARLGPDASDTGSSDTGSSDTSSLDADAGESDADAGPSPRANLLFVDAATGRLLLARIGTGPYRTASASLGAGFSRAAAARDDLVVLLDPVRHKKVSVTLDRSSFALTPGTEEDVNPTYDQVLGLAERRVLWLSSTTGDYVVDEQAGATWTTVAKETASSFKGRNLLARSPSGSLVFTNTKADTWAGTWKDADKRLEGLAFPGGTWGMNHVVPFAGSTFLVYSTDAFSSGYGRLALQQVTFKPGIGWMSLQPFSLAPEAFPWSDRNFTSLARLADGLVLFYRQSDGIARVLSLKPTPDFDAEVEEAPTDATPGPGWTSIVSLP